MKALISILIVFFVQSAFAQSCKPGVDKNCVHLAFFGQDSSTSNGQTEVDKILKVSNCLSRLNEALSKTSLPSGAKCASGLPYYELQTQHAPKLGGNHWTVGLSIRCAGARSNQALANWSPEYSLLISSEESSEEKNSEQFLPQKLWDRSSTKHLCYPDGYIKQLKEDYDNRQALQKTAAALKESSYKPENSHHYNGMLYDNTTNKAQQLTSPQTQGASSAGSAR